MMLRYKIQNGKVNMILITPKYFRMPVFYAVHIEIQRKITIKRKTVLKSCTYTVVSKL